MWDKVKGHNDNKIFLRSLLNGEKAAPSLLFYGRSGVGKRLLAKEFALSYLCLNNQVAGDDCRSCKALRAGTHPDFIQVSQLAPGKALSIEQIKNMARQAAYAPTLSNHKVCIIDGADFMTGEAANSLLKLLEEPPAYWLFILIATDINRLLPTILSRVIQRRFTGLTEPDMAAVLAELQLENPEILAALADGSPGKALAWQELGVLTWRERALYVLENSEVPQIMHFIGQLPWLEKTSSEEGLVFLEMLTLLARDGLLLQEPQGHYQYFNQDLLPRLKACFATWHSHEIATLLDWAGACYRGIAAKSGSRAVLEALILKLNTLRKENKRE